MKNPIYIAGPPRSGTTMLGGLFIKHGAWVGRSRTTQFPGTNPPIGVENIDIKTLMKQEAARDNYSNWHVPLPPKRWCAPVMNGAVRSILPLEEAPLILIKTSWLLTYDHFWRNLFPEARWVLPLRDSRLILDSMNRHPSMRRRPNNLKKKFIKALRERQRAVSLEVPHALFVDTDQISRRNKEELERLFKFIDVEPDWEVVREWIQPKNFKRKL